MAPFTPFITEEIWQSLPNIDSALIVSEYPKYDENLDKRWWEWTSRRLRELNDAYFKNVNGTTYGLITSDNLIEDAIKENDLRWKEKDFYRPKKKWREIRNRIKKQD